jgi:hypothetical protein
MRRLSLLPLVLVGGLLLLVAQQAANADEEVVPPTASRTNHLEVQGGAVVIRDGEAGSAFGTVRVGKGKRQLSYFAVLKHQLGKADNREFNESVSAEDKEGETKQTLFLDGRKVEIVYKVRVVSDKEVSETLTVNGTAAPLKNGRVLLIDLTAKTPTWEQRKADLPAEVEAGDRKATEDLARRVLMSLAKSPDKKTAEFIDKAGR